MRRLWCLLVGLLLAACGGGEPVQPKRELTSFTLRVVMLSRDAAAQACIDLGAWPSDQAEAAVKNRHLGCAVMRHDANECTVYVPRPLVIDDEATTVLGHEVLHCALGRYHP